MKKILVLGGTRYFGQKVVQEFITAGHDVTVATRGQRTDPFENHVTRVVIDRHDGEHPSWPILGAQQWDIVFDNICFTENDANIALTYLKEIKHYLVTSSLAVYEGESTSTGFKEADFAPSSYRYTPSPEVSYGEGKRQVETYFTHRATFPVTYLRFPVVLDDDDYTERLHYYIRKVLQEESITFRRSEGLFGFIRASEIPQAITFVIANKVFGPLNIASDAPFTTERFLATLANTTGKEPLLRIGSEDISPFSHYDSVLDLSRLSEAGYPVTSLASWLPDLMKRLTVQEQQNVTK